MTSSKQEPVHVHVIGGFLGSGKTTLLERLVAFEAARGARPGVVENELGEADVDGRRLHEAHDHASVEVVGLTGGCVCCDQSDELGRIVLEMALARRRTSVFVETTGLASLAQTVDALDAALVTTRGVRRGRVIGVVDATRIEGVVAQWEAAREHLRPADVVLVNKLDLATPSEARRAEQLARRLAPRGQILLTTHANVDPAHVLGGRARGPAAATSRRRPSRIVDSTRGFTTSSFFVTRPVDLEALEALARRYARSLVRLKGLVAVPDDARAHEVQWSGTSFETRPYPHAVARPYLVAIGKRMRWDPFLDALADCLVRVIRKTSTVPAPSTTRRS